MSAVHVRLDGSSLQLDRRPEPDEQVTPEQISDPSRMTRLLMRLLRDVAILRRRWWPRHIDFEIAPDGDSMPTASVHRLSHRFGGPVRFWLVDAKSSGPVSPPIRVDTSDENILVLNAYFTGSAVVRVEEAGA